MTDDLTIYQTIRDILQQADEKHEPFRHLIIALSLLTDIVEQLTTGQNIPQLVKQCPECGGEGVVPSLAWLAWRKDHGKNAMPNDDEQYELGPEENVCVRCDQTGRILTVAGRAMLTFVGRHEGTLP